MNGINEQNIDLYDVDFKSFKFEEGKVYKGEVEIIGDYFYKESKHSNKRTTNYYYYNAKLKNKYNDEIYVVERLNDGARTNMIKSGDKTFEFTGVIVKNSNKIKNAQLQSLNLYDESNVFNIRFDASPKEILRRIGILSIASSVIFVVIVYPLATLVNKKNSEKNKENMV